MLRPRKNVTRVAAILFVVGLTFLIWSPYERYCEAKNANDYYCAGYGVVVTLGSLANDYGVAITALATIAIAAFTWTLWSTNKSQLAEFKRSVDSTVEKDVAELRAYVYLDITSRAWPPPPRVPNRHSIVLVVRNAGKTWGRNFRLGMGRFVNPPIHETAFEDFEWVMPLSTKVLGPGQEITLQFGDVQFGEEIEAIVNGSRSIFYVAWATYEDALTDPPILRHTQLFRRLNADIEGGVSFTWMDTHNWADEDCK